MNEDLKELGITPDHDMDEDPKVDGEVGTGEDGLEKKEDNDDADDLSMLEEEKIRQADPEDYEKDEE